MSDLTREAPSHTRSTLIVTLFTALGMSLAFLSNIVIAAKFGAGTEMDAYLAATTLPLFITTLLSGSLYPTFLPVYSEYKERDSRELWRIVSTILNFSFLASVALTVLGIWLSDPIMKLLAPGFSPEHAQRSAHILRILFPTVILTVINDLIASLFYSKRAFVIPSLIKIIGPALTIAYVLLFSRTLSTVSLALATVSAGLVQTVISVLGLARLGGYSYRLSLDLKHPAVAKVLKLVGPLILSMLAYKGLPLFDRWIGSQLPEGSISILGYANKLITAVQPVLLSGIALAFYPVMADFAAKRDYQSLKDTMQRSMRMLLFASVPIAIFLGALGEPFIQFLFERGSFTHESTLATCRAFGIYLIALPAALAGTILAQGFYVIQDTRTPAVVGILETILYVALCLCLLPILGVFSIPASYALYFNASFVVLMFILSKKLGHNLFAILFPTLFIQTLGALPGLGTAWLMIALLPPSIATLAAALGAGFLVYFLILKYVCKSPEAVMIQSRLLARIPLNFLRRLA